MPVHLLTIFGDVFFVDFFFQHAGPPAAPSCCSIQLLQLGLQLRQLAVLHLRGTFEVAAACLLLRILAHRFHLLFQFREAGDVAALLLPVGAQGGRFPLAAWPAP